MSPLAAQGVRFDSGLSVASGEYGSGEVSTSITWTQAVAFELDRVTLRASMPLVAQRGSAVLTAAGSVPGHGESRDSTAMGGPRRVFGTDTSVEDYRVRIGDPYVSASLRVFEDWRTSLNVGLAVKAPVAEAGDVGTGEWDAGISADLSRHVSGPWFAAAGGAWWKLGDPDGIDLRDPVLGTLTLSRLDSGHAAALMFSAGTAAATSLDPPLSVGAMVSRDLWSGTAAVSATIGLTESAADFSVGASWGVALRE